MPDSTRCCLHGAGGGRPRGISEHPNSRAARLEGRRRWVERMRAAKLRGEITRFPGGRRARDLPPLARDPKIRKAQRLVEQAMVDKDVVTIEELPWEVLSKGEKLGAVTDVAVRITRDILALGVDPSDPKILQIVKDTALSVIASQVRVDTAALQASAIRHAREMSQSEFDALLVGADEVVE